MGFYDIYKIQGEDVRSRQLISNAIADYLDYLKSTYEQMSVKEIKETLLSDYNFRMRSQYRSCRAFGNTIKTGDICFLDYGRAYIQEAGYQHFGLVFNIFDAKAFVIPMTSNFNAYSQAYDELRNPDGLKHLMRLGKPDGLNKYSVLFLNDAKFINMARIIEVKGHIDKESQLYKEISRRLMMCLEQEQ